MPVSPRAFSSLSLPLPLSLAALFARAFQLVAVVSVQLVLYPVSVCVCGSPDCCMGVLFLKARIFFRPVGRSLALSLAAFGRVCQVAVSVIRLPVILARLVLLRLSRHLAQSAASALNTTSAAVLILFSVLISVLFQFLFRFGRCFREVFDVI